jgi:pantothenate kinase
MDMLAHEKEDVMEAEQICKEIKKLIAREKEEGTNEDAEIEKLQQAYDLCEEFITAEKAEVGEPKQSKANPFAKKAKAPAPKPNAATMPMDNLKASLPAAPSTGFKGNLNAY